MGRYCRAKGLTRVEVAVIMLASTFFLSLLPATLRHVRSDAARVACGANLAAIGKAMLAYAGDNNGELPRAGGSTTIWGAVYQWNAPDRYRAFGLAADGSGGAATINSCLYLLVKYMGVPPSRFVCPGEKGITEFKLAGQPVQTSFTLADAWDFGPGVDPHCSYAYQVPFGLYAPKTTADPGLAVAADSNPWLKGSEREPSVLTNFKPDLPPFKGTVEQARAGNSTSHGGDGQNVLFLDGHVKFEERSYCGLDRDNIYLISNDKSSSSPVGTVPMPPCVLPANPRDSILVHDPPHLSPIAYVARTARPVSRTDSRQLKQTAVVATLDCPLPEHKNAIWCATFQMAWDRFRQDIVGEPVQVPQAEELASRLNRATYSTDNIEAKSYYAAAGFVKDGIIEQVQREMKRRFPSEPVPTFSSAYRALPETVLAYGYLNVDVGFHHPYYTYLSAFDFHDSNDVRTPVTAFCAQSSIRSGNYERLRKQVEVLYYEYGDTPETAHFAVDLCRQTQPYQVVLTRVPRCNTLGEAAQALREKTCEFKSDPDYEVLRKLRPIDTLIVPDVACKLAHRFQELLGKGLGNPKWSTHFIFEALQDIDFTLSRTGVVVKSVALFSAASGRSAAQLAQPRHLHFDRPFLICVRKRERDAVPFFLMWVDNAELMNPYGDDAKGR